MSVEWYCGETVKYSWYITAPCKTLEVGNTNTTSDYGIWLAVTEESGQFK